MRPIKFTEEEWKRRDRPRRYELVLGQQNATKLVASVAVWEEVGDGTLREAEVSVILAADAVVIESSHTFDGEARLTF